MKTSSPLLSVKKLSVAFKSSKQKKKPVSNVSFSINRGESLAIVGESGSGKSLTALSVVRLLPYPDAHHPTGTVTFDGIDIGHAKGAELRKIRNKRIGFVFQEPLTSLNPLHPIGKQIMEVLILHQGMKEDQAKKQALQLLEHVRLRDPKKRFGAYPFQLSGGERQRVVIAIAIANKPDLLIADEPTTALDVTVQAQILDILKDLQSRFNMALLIISHDLTVVEKVADRVLVMRHGEVIEEGKTLSVFQNPKSTYTQTLINAIPKGFLPALKKTPPLLSVSRLSVSFRRSAVNFFKRERKFQALRNINLSLHESETLGIVGESGSGKSTLAFSIVRLAKYSGTVVFLGKNIRDVSRKELRKLRPDLQLVFQDPYSSLNPKLTIREIITEGLTEHQKNKTPGEIEDILRVVLKNVRLEQSLCSRLPHELSGGQRQRVAIARALVLKPKLIVLDEPTSALDLSIQREILDILKSFQKEHKISYLFISHDLRVIKSISHRVIVMKKGQIVETGTVRDIFLRPKKPYTKELMKAAFIK